MRKMKTVVKMRNMKLALKTMTKANFEDNGGGNEENNNVD